MSKKTTTMERSRRRKYTPRDRQNEVGFDAKTIDRIVSDMQEGRMIIPQTTITDPERNGLRAIIRKSGLVTFHVQYYIGDSRPMLKIGEHPAMSIANARKIAATIQHLSELDIDVQEGLHDRLIRELLEQGTKWRP